MKKLTKKNFAKIYHDIHWFYQFQWEDNSTTYEICLEPCMQGFDVALYKKYPNHAKLIAAKRCTMDKEYDEDILGQMDRTEKTFKKAIKFANEIIDNYFSQTYAKQ